MKAIVVVEEAPGRPLDPAIRVAVILRASGADTTALVAGSEETCTRVAREAGTRVLGVRSDDDALIAGIEAALDEVMPDLVLFPVDSVAEEIGARLAARRGLPFVPDCVELTAAPGRSGDESGAGALTVHSRVALIRRIESGEYATVVPTRLPAVATVLPDMHRDLVAAAAGDGPDVPDAPSEPVPDIRLGAPSSETAARPAVELLDAHVAFNPGRLDDAAVVVGIGSGLGATELAAAEELAEILGGVVGGSRRPVDAGWLTSDRKIGETGHRIAARLYLALGVSGAPQHLVGIARARRIAAIDVNPDTPLMARADIAVTADARALLPLLIRELRALRERAF